MVEYTTETLGGIDRACKGSPEAIVGPLLGRSIVAPPTGVHECALTVVFCLTLHQTFFEVQGSYNHTITVLTTQLWPGHKYPGPPSCRCALKAMQGPKMAVNSPARPNRSVLSQLDKPYFLQSLQEKSLSRLWGGFCKMGSRLLWGPIPWVPLKVTWKTSDL